MLNFIKAFAVAAGISLTAGLYGIVLDFDTDAGGNPIVTGQIIDNEYAGFGVNIVVNNLGGGPDLGVAFDSNNPTPGDPDLATPGFGLNNNQAFNNLLIIQTNGADGGDGIINTTPNDEAGGGTIDFFFSIDQLFATVDIIDIEETGGSISLFLDGALQSTQALAALGDNSYQQIAFNEILFDQLTVDFAGSGGVAQVAVKVPEPETWLLMSTALFGVLLATHRRRVRRAKKSS